MLLNEKKKEALLPVNPSSLTLRLWCNAFGNSLQSDVLHTDSFGYIFYPQRESDLKYVMYGGIFHKEFNFWVSGQYTSQGLYWSLQKRPDIYKEDNNHTVYFTFSS